MQYVIYHKDTTRFLRIWRNRYWDDAKFASEGAAKAALTRLEKAGKVVRADYLISDIDTFRTIEKTEVVKNLMSGKDVVQSVNTPRSCDVSSELYWSM